MCLKREFLEKLMTPALTSTRENGQIDITRNSKNHSNIQQVYCQIDLKKKKGCSEQDKHGRKQVQ